MFWEIWNGWSSKTQPHHFEWSKMNKTKSSFKGNKNSWCHQVRRLDDHNKAPDLAWGKIIIWHTEYRARKGMIKNGFQRPKYFQSNSWAFTTCKKVKIKNFITPQNSAKSQAFCLLYYYTGKLNQNGLLKLDSLNEIKARWPMTGAHM